MYLLQDEVVQIWGLGGIFGVIPAPHMFGVDLHLFPVQGPTSNQHFLMGSVVWKLDLGIPFVPVLLFFFYSRQFR